MSDDESSRGGETWIEWFCGLKGHEFFCEVDRRYIEDKFNLYGLRAVIPNYLECLSLILDKTDDDAEPETLQNAIDLYGMIHARYIITTRGLDMMLRKYQIEAFGTCPNVQCHNHPVVPVGTHDDLRFDQVKIYCPKCQNIFKVTTPEGAEELDGAYFGSTFAHLFFLSHPHLAIPSRPKPYVPRVFGYRVHGVGPAREQSAESAGRDSTEQSQVERLKAEVAALKGKLAAITAGEGGGAEDMVLAGAEDDADVQARMKKKRTEAFD